MSATRRTVLGTALAGPLLGHLAGTAAGADKNDRFGTISEGWVEVRWTPQAQAQLDRFQATVQAIAPARLIEDKAGTAIRFPVRTATGDPALTNLPKAQGSDRLDGGVVVRTPMGEFRVTELESVLESGQTSGRCAVNGAQTSMQSLFICGAGEGRLVAQPVPAGQPLKVRISDVPLRPTPESLSAFTTAFGAPAVTTDTVMAYVTGEGVYTPPGR
ncbi:hypothetical protein [Streptomyces violaceusniger]|uniref:hypothetical protein n=1 Tax=Streptomyces violaceusniger TaxID=68280 RepID=UPI0038296F60